MILWYIDEEADDRFTYKRQLEKLTQNKLTVRAVAPARECNEMAEMILLEDQTVAVLIDQRLSDSGDVTYNGLDLAKAIRKQNDKIPLYILTNHTNDLSPNEWEIEYVFSKSDFIDNKHSIGERIKRHINIFFEISQARERRFAELLKKSINETLNEDELDELESLDYYRSIPILRKEASFSSKLKSKLDDQEKLLNEIKEKLDSKDE